MNAHLITKTTLVPTLMPCARCKRLYAPGDLLRSLNGGEWRCRDLNACLVNRGENADIARELRQHDCTEAA